jgi:ATP-dependent RNA helicase MSS116
MFHSLFHIRSSTKHPLGPLPQLSSLRQASALATATRPVQEDLPSNNDQPEFAELDGVLSPKLLAAVTEDMKLTHMSPVQAVVLPQLAQLARPYDPNEPKDAPPRDLLVKARTGTGKTLAFLLPAIQGRLDAIEAYAQQAAKDTGNENNEDFIERARLSYARENVGIVIISPTRELANQIAAEALRVTQRIRGFGVRTLVGGESKGAQMRGWTKGRLDVVVATPGRLQDLLQSEPEVKRGVSKAKMVCLFFACDVSKTLTDGFIARSR